MHQVLIVRELRFGQARERHRTLIVRRDSDLAELDALRATAAHHRAYLEHHGAGGMDWGDFRRTDPISRDWGYERGTPSGPPLYRGLSCRAFVRHPRRRS